MLNLSAAAMLEKNKLSSDGAWLILLEVDIANSDETLHIVRNTEDVVWNGITWVAFPFDLDAATEDGKGELPLLNLKISNVSQVIQYYLEQYSGLVGSTVILRVVHSKHLDSAIPEIEETFSIQSSSADANWATFGLGADFSVNVRFPGRRVMKNFCPFQYKGIECGYTGSLPECNRTLTACRERKNSLRFGGEPSIPQGGLYASSS